MLAIRPSNWGPFLEALSLDGIVHRRPASVSQRVLTPWDIAALRFGVGGMLLVPYLWQKAFPSWHSVSGARGERRRLPMWLLHSRDASRTSRRPTRRRHRGSWPASSSFSGARAAPSERTIHPDQMLRRRSCGRRRAPPPPRAAGPSRKYFSTSPPSMLSGLPNSPNMRHNSCSVTFACDVNEERTSHRSIASSVYRLK